MNEVKADVAASELSASEWAARQAEIEANEALAIAEERREQEAKRVAIADDEKVRPTRAQRQAELRASDEQRAADDYSKTPQSLLAEQRASDKDAAERARLRSIVANAPDRLARLIATGDLAAMDRASAARRTHALMAEIQACKDERESARLRKEYAAATIESEIAMATEEDADAAIRAEETRVASKEYQDAALTFAMAQKGTSPKFVASHTKEARARVADGARAFLAECDALNGVYAECNQRIDALQKARDVLQRTDALPPYELHRDPIEMLQAVIDAGATK